MDAILSVNPGTTTTRCALYAAEGQALTLLAEETLEHDETQMAGFATIPDQFDYRLACVHAFLDRKLGKRRLVACAGRAGCCHRFPPG